MIKVLQMVKESPGILQKDVLAAGANHKDVMILLKQKVLRRDWSGYGYKLYPVSIKIDDYIKIYIQGTPSASGLTANLHGEAFRTKFDEVFGLDAI